MRVLVTGSSGYIGSGLCNFLDSVGISTSKCDLGWFGTKPGINYVNEPLENYEIIIHLAGHSSVALCESDKKGAWINNVTNFKSVVDSLKENQTLIYASSGSVYGNLSHTASEEDVALNSLMTYDMTKIIKDVISLNALNASKNIIGLRFGTVNGISPNTRTDLMMNSMVWNALTNQRILVKNPKISRPILFLKDLYEGMLAVIQNPISGLYNLASQNVTVESVANFIHARTEAPIIRLEDDANPYNFSLNCTKFKNTFGSYQKSQLSDVLEELVEGILNVKVGRRDVLSTEEMFSLRQ